MVEPLLEAVGLRRRYRRPDRPQAWIAAVDGVTLELARGSALGVVGQSGSGKSTLVRLLLAVERPDQGTVRFDGRPISDLSPSEVRPLRRRFQAVFQDPIGSLNPRLRVGTIVAEPLVAHDLGTASQRRARVAELFELVGLPADSARRYPGAFSGGERQRIAIARALAPEPELLILDEPVSSLDVTVQAEILDLLGELHRRLGLALLLVSHDLQVVRHVAHHTAVMFAGVIVERGATTAVLDRPAHPFSRALLRATPRPDSLPRPPARPVASGPCWPSGACRYAALCPAADDRCRTEPSLETINGDRAVACWHPLISSQD